MERKAIGQRGEQQHRAKRRIVVRHREERNMMKRRATR